MQIGKVTKVDVKEGRSVEATLSLNTAPKIPADLTAAVRSMSAVGEQYIDLQPRNESGPYLRDGSVITADHTTVPQQVGPMLDQVSALVDSIPGDRLGDLLNESFKAFNGSGYDVGSMLDSAGTVSHDLDKSGDRARALIDDSRPLLEGQVQSADNLRALAHSIAGVSGQITTNDPQVRNILAQGPGAADEASRLLTSIKPTLPVLLANLTTISQVAVTYHPSIEQLLVLLPPAISTTQASGAMNNPTGLPMGDFELGIGDPPACNVGFLPPSMWRSPNDFTDVDTPDGLYCKLPQDSPISVRGARNYPCMGNPGKRAPTVEICNSDQQFVPLAMRPHALGPTPIDPNLIAQGVPQDSRVDPSRGLYGPPAGPPQPQQVTPPAADAPPPPADQPAAPQIDAPSTSGPATAAPEPAEVNPVAAPAAYSTATPATPSVAVVRYNRQTGAYMGPDGRMYRQSDLTAHTNAAPAWTDLVLGGQP